MSEDFVVKVSGKSHNIKKFLRFHPGGSNTLRPYANKDVTKPFQANNHSEAARELLRDYLVSEDDPTKRARDQNEEGDLENLVNWDKAMFWQVGFLGANYNKWVLSPVDRKLRLFEYDFMEFLTITPWFLVPGIWIPFCVYLLRVGIQDLYSIPDYAGNFNLLYAITLFVFISGFFLWPLIEYAIHRWIFHKYPPANSPLLITLHFTIHGLHHKVPFDDQRLLFPPVATGIVIWILYKFLALFLPHWMVPIMVAGGTLGYVTYDLIHFHLHYGSPKEGTYLYHMKRYHNQHHFALHNIGYGISSPIWDMAFGTTIKLKKIGYSLKWD